MIWKGATHTRVEMVKNDNFGSKKKVKITLAKAKEIESDTCQSEDNMKIPLFKFNARKNDTHKHESDTYENKGTQRWHLRKFTGMSDEIATRVRETVNGKCALTINIGWTLYRKCILDYADSINDDCASTGTSHCVSFIPRHCASLTFKCAILALILKNIGTLLNS